MTVAVCFKCGKLKFGAWVPCPHCNNRPKEKYDVALSVAMSDHYFDKDTLEKIGQAVANGTPPVLSEEDKADLYKLIDETGVMSKLGQDD